MEIVLLRGPLEDPWPAEIARTYGTHDRKYADREFQRRQFDENPYGFSLHAFARDGDRVVGHCSVIPVVTRFGDEVRMTGKTEALFVAASHRGRRDGRESVAQEMVRELYSFSDTEGFADIHSLGRPEFAKVHAAGGARVLELERTQYAFDLAGDDPADGGPSPGDLEIEEVQLADYDTLDLDAFARLAPLDGRWTVPPTSESMWWLLGSPAMRRMRVSSGDQRFECVYSGEGSGTWLEVFDWRGTEGSEELAAAALSRLIAGGRAEGRELLCFFDWGRYNPDAAILEGAGKRLGFAAVDRPRLVYVRSEDPAFESVDGMTFSPYLYATF